MTQQRLCNKCGIEGREKGRFAAGKREKEKSYLEGKKGNGNRGFPPTLFRLVTWRGRDRESHFLSQHVTYYQENERVISILN